MAKVMTDESNYTAIAGAIRTKLGVSTRYKPSEMADAIESIPTGAPLTSEDEGKVVVEDSGNYVLAEQTSLSVSQNGTYDTTTNDEVVVNVSSQQSSGPILAGPFQCFSYNSPMYLYMFNNETQQRIDPDWSIPFELVFTFVCVGTVSHSQVFCGPESGFVSAPTIEIQSSSSNNSFWFGLSDGSSQAWSGTISMSEFPISLNKYYTIGMVYDGTNAKVFVTDGTNTVEKTTVVTFTPSSSKPQYQIGTINNSNAHYLEKTLLDMGNTYFKQNGVLIWGGQRS